jgi:hypothetical protein
VVTQLEKLRESAMVTVRTQIRTMYEHLHTLAQARQQIQDDHTWYEKLVTNLCVCDTLKRIPACHAR